MAMDGHEIISLWKIIVYYMCFFIGSFFIMWGAIEWDKHNKHKKLSKRNSDSGFDIRP